MSGTTVTASFIDTVIDRAKADPAYAEALFYEMWRRDESRDALLLRLSAAVCDLLVQSPVTDRETRREIEALAASVRKSANADP